MKFEMNFTVKLSENSFYHYKSFFKQENILKYVFAICLLISSANFSFQSTN